VVVERYSLLAVYVVVFYDWITSLDEEVALIYPAPWNVVKAAYIFCRHYPMAIAPFHLWGLLSNHEQHFCESYYLAFFACAIPTILSSQFILMLRTYAFSGRKRSILAILSLAFFGLVGVIIWVMSNELSRLSRRPCSSKCIPDSAVKPQCRPCSLSSNAAVVSLFRINRP
jgi:hypothetical protein